MSQLSNKKGTIYSLILVSLIACLAAAGIAIFYGLISLSDAGLLDFLANDIWLTSLIFAGVVLGWMFLVLFIGNRIIQKSASKEKVNG